jgi:hypothetical protein
MAKIGEKNYDLGAFVNRGWHELGNSLYPESNIPLRDHSGLYGRGENRDVEPHREPEVNVDGPDLEGPDIDEPEME